MKLQNAFFASLLTKNTGDCFNSLSQNLKKAYFFPFFYGNTKNNQQFFCLSTIF
jgi:hypothetical protein